MSGPSVGPIQNPPTMLTNAPAGNSGAPGQVGKNQAGQSVRASNVSSPLAQAADIAEEIGALRSQFKKNDKRELSKAKTSSERQLEMIEKIKIVEKMHGTEDFKKNLSGKSNLKQDDYLEDSQEEFEDPYHQYVALLEVAVETGAEPGDEIFQAIDKLEKQHPQYIEIGKEISRAAGFLADKYSDQDYSSLNEKLFGNVKDYKSLGDAFKSFGSIQGADGFTKSVDTQLKSLSADLNKLPATPSDEHLKAVIDDMTTLKRLVGIHDSCMEAKGEMTRPPIEVQEFDAHQYMTKVLDLMDQSFVSSDNFDKLMTDMNLNDSSTLVKTAFINKTATLIGSVPEEVFKTDQAKGGILEAIKIVQDNLVLAEEGTSSIDPNYGKHGEVEIDDEALNNFLTPGGILDDIMPAKVSSETPNIAENNDKPESSEDSPSKEPVAKDSEGVQSEPVTGETVIKGDGAAIQEETKPANPEPQKPDSGTPDPAKPGNNPDPIKPGSADNNDDIVKDENLDGLTNEQLLQKQEEYLDKARDLYIRKDTDFVFNCSTDALKYAEENDSDILGALNHITKERGNGKFAHGLKVGITPSPGEKELQLIPPDEKALKAWQEKNPDKSIKDLLRTAIEVLEENRDSDYDAKKIERQLSSIGNMIGQLDSRIKDRPFKVPFKSSNKFSRGILAESGIDTFKRFEFSHQFSINAKEKDMSVHSSFDESKKNKLEDDDIAVKATLNESETENPLTTESKNVLKKGG